jgi:CBS domain-containing protein
MQYIEPQRLHGKRTAIVADLMSRRVWTCHRDDTLERAAQLMWEHGCGVVPVVDDRGNVVGMVTDRDVCMAAYTQGLPLSRIPVHVAASHHVFAVRPDEAIAEACASMRQHRVRRLAVVDVGGNLVGILSLADIARHAWAVDREQVAEVLTDVSRPSRPPPG